MSPWGPWSRSARWSACLSRCSKCALADGWLALTGLAARERARALHRPVGSLSLFQYVLHAVAIETTLRSHFIFLGLYLVRRVVNKARAQLTITYLAESHAPHTCPNSALAAGQSQLFGVGWKVIKLLGRCSFLAVPGNSYLFFSLFSSCDAQMKHAFLCSFQGKFTGSSFSAFLLTWTLFIWKE